MSLVAYGASSDEDSDCADEQETSKAEVLLRKPTTTVATEIGDISDEDEDFTPPIDAPLQERKAGSFLLTLPKPKISALAEQSIKEEIEGHVTLTFSKLPMPKQGTVGAKHILEEEDDEFLHKKAIPINSNEKPKEATVAKGPVKIIIPALKDFKDVDKELADKMKNKTVSRGQAKGCGLLSLLPQAKSEQNFAKAPSSGVDSNTPTAITRNSTQSTKPAFVPDTVKSRRPAHNTEGVDGIKAGSGKIQKNVGKPKIALVNCSDSEASDEDGGDFFSLNAEDKLPEVSANEINALVAKRAAKMAEAASKYLSTKSTTEVEPEQAQPNEEEVRYAQKRYHKQLDAEAVQALVGSSAKRRRNQQQGIQVMDISSDQVLPNQEDWMRTALASSTAYQPTGVLVDEEPVAGTRRKHQITYLAHKAKANEAELQAMWAANRQTRRATQSKYGF